MLHMNGGLFTCICWFLISVCQKEWDKSKQLQLLNELHNMKKPSPSFATALPPIFEYY